jgi:hypothetical protein
MPRQIITTADAPSSPLYSQGVKAGPHVLVSGITASTRPPAAWPETPSRSRRGRPWRTARPSSRPASIPTWDTHTAAICDTRGRAVVQLQVPATTAGYAELLARVRQEAGARRVIWAVEGTRHYGLGLARHLAGAGEQVTEIDSTRHVGRRRAAKSDPIDSARAARELLARPHPAQMRADGDREALRLLMIDRDNAVQSGKTARTALAAVLVAAPAGLREQLRGLARERRARECAALTCPPGADRQARVLHETLIRLGCRLTPGSCDATGSPRRRTGHSPRRAPRPGPPPSSMACGQRTAGDSAASSTSSPGGNPARSGSPR